MEDRGMDVAGDIRFRPLRRGELMSAILDELVPAGHPVRAVEALARELDFTALFGRIGSRVGHAGAPASDPRVLFALWLYATSEGVVSARDLEQRCRRDLAYLWLCGQDPPNYHTLAAFYSANEAWLAAVFADHLEVLLEQGLITLAEVTVDGRKIPAAASKESFHREPTLTRHRQEAEEHLAKCQARRAAGPAADRDDRRTGSGPRMCRGRRASRLT